MEKQNGRWVGKKERGDECAWWVREGLEFPADDVSVDW
jgi:hypothetical protein